MKQKKLHEQRHRGRKTLVKGTLSSLEWLEQRINKRKQSEIRGPEDAGYQIWGSDINILQIIGHPQRSTIREVTWSELCFWKMHMMAVYKIVLSIVFFSLSIYTSVILFNSQNNSMDKQRKWYRKNFPMSPERWKKHEKSQRSKNKNKEKTENKTKQNPHICEKQLSSSTTLPHRWISSCIRAADTCYNPFQEVNDNIRYW